MLRSALLSAVVGLSLLSTGCGPIEREMTHKMTFTVETSGDTCGVDSFEVDLGEDADFTQYQKNITGLEVKSIKVTVLNPKTREDAVATKASGSVSVSAPGSTEKVAVGGFTDVSLTEGSSATPNVDAAGSARLGTLLLAAPHKATLHFEGCVDQTPAGFEVEAEVTYIVKASLI
jgi:hypothetical protein